MTLQNFYAALQSIFKKCPPLLRTITAISTLCQYCKSANETVSKEIEKVNTWLLTTSNKLTLNFLKTDYLLFSPKVPVNEQINFSVSIQGNQIKRTQVARYLDIFQFLLMTN